jgi:hypothetical protein
VSKRERRTLASCLEVLAMHLLKWCYQPARRGRSWPRTIQEQRLQIALLLIRSPSLHAAVPECLHDAYRRACQRAARETQLPEAAFPDACPWTAAQILDQTFWPEEAG